MRGPDVVNPLAAARFVLLASSPLFSQPRLDLYPTVRLTGFFRPEDDGQPGWSEPDAALSAFVGDARDRDVLAIVPGSIPVPEPARWLSALVGAARALGLKTVVQAGWTGLEPALLGGGPTGGAASDVLFAATLPHDWLYACSAAIVFHGQMGANEASHASSPPSRKYDAECRPLADLASHGDGATVRLDDGLRDREPEARSALCPRGVCPVEALEDVRQVLGRDARARVGDFEDDRTSRPSEPHVDTPARVGVLDRVVHEVLDELAKSRAIAVGNRLAAARCLTCARDAALGRGRGEAVANVAREGVEGHGLDLQQQAAGPVGAREVEEPRGEAREVLDLLENARQRRPVLLRRALAAERDLDLGAQRGERRAELVRGVRGEATRRRECLFDRPDRPSGEPASADECELRAAGKRTPRTWASSRCSWRTGSSDSAIHTS
jgi:hypothetical protein